MNDCYRGKEMRYEYNGLWMKHGVAHDYDPYLVVQPDSTVPCREGGDIETCRLVATYAHTYRCGTVKGDWDGTQSMV